MTISFSGLASGLDTSSWIESLVALKRAKITTLEEQKEEVIVSRDSLSTIKSFFTAFRASLERVTDAKLGISSLDLFVQKLATTSNTDYITATADTSAKEATYNIVVQDLATNTQAKSRYDYTTTATVTATATSDSKLIHLGVNIQADGGSDIAVKVNGVQRGIHLTQDDSINSFIDKLKDIGVDSSYNPETGVFNIGVSQSDIVELATDPSLKTNIVDKLHLNGVNEGYTATQWQEKTVETIWTIANRNTKFNELSSSVTSGSIVFNSHEANYTFNVSGTTTVGNFEQALINKGIEASFDDLTGILTITDASIVSDSANVSSALGFDIDTYSIAQKSGDLKQSETITTMQTATYGTKITDIGLGVTINNSHNKVVVQNSNNILSTITLTTSSTIGSLIAGMTDAGLFATLNSDGTIEIAGGEIKSTSTFDVITAFGLETEPYDAMAMGNQLTETIIVPQIVELTTRLVEDLGVSRGYYEVKNPDGDTFYRSVYSGQTIADLITDLGNLGISASLDGDSGVLTLYGGQYRTLTNSEVQSLCSGEHAAIVGVLPEDQKGTNLLTCLGLDVEANMSVYSTRSKSRALTKTTYEAVDATESSQLSLYGVSGNNTVVVYDSDGHAKATTTVTGTTTLGTLVDFINNNGGGVTASLNDGVITINDGFISSPLTSTELNAPGSIIKGAVVTALGLENTNMSSYVLGSVKQTTTTISATAAQAITSSAKVQYTQEHVATEDSCIWDYTGSLTYSNWNANANVNLDVKYEDGSDALTGLKSNITASTTFGEFFALISQVGVDGDIHDGIITFTSSDDKYLVDVCTAGHENEGLLKALGIETSYETVFATTTVGTSQSVHHTYITTDIADNTSIINDFITINTTGTNKNDVIEIKDKNGHVYQTVSVSATETFGDLFNRIAQYGVDGDIQNGKVTFLVNEGGYVDGSFIGSKGLNMAPTNVTTTITTTSGTTQSSPLKTYSVTETADAASTINDFITINSSGTNQNNQIIIKDYNGVATQTVTVTNTMTFSDLFGQLARYGVDGDIENGRVTFMHNNGGYVDGNFIGANGLNIAPVTTVIATTTSHGVNTTKSGLVYTITEVATSETLLKDLGIELTDTFRVGYYNGNSYDVYEITMDDWVNYWFTSLDTMTVGEFFSGLNQECGIYGSIDDGYIQLTSPQGNYIAVCDVATKLGIGNYTYTVESNSTSTFVIEQTNAPHASYFLDDIFQQNMVGLQSVSEVGVANIVSGGTYAVSSTADLLALSGFYESGTCVNFVMTNDIDMSGVDLSSWVGISLNDSSVFYGNGYAITNFNQTVTTDNTSGIFSFVSDAKVCDLEVRDSTILVESPSSGYYGLLVNTLEREGIIENCVVKNSELDINTSNTSRSHTAGLVCAKIDTNGGTIKDTYVEDSVLHNKTNYRVLNSNDAKGFIVGSNTGGNITNCHAINSTFSGAFRYAGGIAGHASGGNITDCTASGLVLQKDGDVYYIGGIAGCLTGCRLTNGYTKDITDFDTATSNYGGVIGYVTDSNYSNYVSPQTIYERSENSVNIASPVQDDISSRITQALERHSLVASDYLVDHIELTTVSVQGSTTNGLMNDIVRIDTSDMTRLSSISSTTRVDNGVFCIATGDEMLQLANMVNNGLIGSGATFVLGASVSTGSDVNIGTSTNKFNATFDGNGYIVDIGDNQGAFGYIGEEGVVKNVRCDGNRTLAYDNAGTISNCYTDISPSFYPALADNSVYNDGQTYKFAGFAYKNTGMISDCYAQTAGCSLMGTNGEIFNISGIASINKGTIQGCYVSFEEGFYFDEQAGSMSFSGIADSNSGLIQNCATAGYTYWDLSTGSIAGATTNAISSGGRIVNCATTATSVVYTSGLGPQELDLDITNNNSGSYGNVYGHLNTVAQNVVNSLRPDGKTWEYGVVTTTTIYTTETIEPEESRFAKNIKRIDTSTICALGTGIVTGTNTYKISTTEELQLATHDTYSGKTFILANDIDLSGQDWVTSTVTFAGTFDGNGYTISGMSISTIATSSTTSEAGLFCGIAINGKVKNLHMDNVYITVTANSTTTSNVHAGAISGYIYGGTVENCYVTNMTVQASGTVNYAPTIGGLAAGANNSSIVTDCYVDNIQITNNIKGAQSAFVGGLLGAAIHESQITNSHANNVSIIGLMCQTGGLIGYAEGQYGTHRVKITGCSAYVDLFNCTGNGRIDGTTEIGLGGLVGNVANYVYINDCYSACDQVLGSYDYYGSVCGRIMNSTIRSSYTDSIANQIGYYDIHSSDYEVDISYMNDIEGYVANHTNPHSQIAYDFIRGYETVVSTQTVQPLESDFMEDVVRIDVSNLLDIETLDEALSYYTGTYKITTTAGLQKLARMVNNGQFASMDDKFVLGNDISLAGDADWTSIGNEYNNFWGTFDGNGYKITNLKQTTTTDSYYQGLFGNSYGTIRNVGIEGVSITNSSGNHVASLVALSYGTVENCYAKNVTITASSSIDGDVNIGGMVGTFVYGVINHCYTDSVSISSSRTESFSHIGGLCGMMWDGSEATNVFVNNINISGKLAATGGVSGIAASLSNALATNVNINMTGYASGNHYCLGGVVGSLYKLISDEPANAGNNLFADGINISTSVTEPSDESGMGDVIGCLTGNVYNISSNWSHNDLVGNVKRGTYTESQIYHYVSFEEVAPIFATDGRIGTDYAVVPDLVTQIDYSTIITTTTTTIQTTSLVTDETAAGFASQITRADSTDLTSISSLDLLSASENSIHGTYKVSTTQELSDMLKYGDRFASDAVIRLANDISATGVSGLFINENEFRATFNGNGYTISGYSAVSNSSTIGMFGDVSGQVRNLHLQNCAITNIDNNGTAGIIASTCTGWITNCIVENCTISVDNTNPTIIGFVCGKLDGSNSKIVGCRVIDSVMELQYNSSILSSKIGGICGVAGFSGAGTVPVINNCSVKGCSNTGGITLSSGGLVGSEISRVNIADCYSVSNSFLTSNAAVGNVGAQFNKIERCWVDDYVAKSTSFAYGNAEVTDCYYATPPGPVQNTNHFTLTNNTLLLDNEIENAYQNYINNNSYKPQDRVTTNTESVSTETVITPTTYTIQVQHTVVVPSTENVTAVVETSVGVAVTQDVEHVIEATIGMERTIVGTALVAITQAIATTSLETITVDNTTTQTIRANCSLEQKTWDHEYNAGLTTTLGELFNTATVTGTIAGVATDGATFSIVLDANTTLGNLASRLAAYGIDVAVDNGHFNAYYTNNAGGGPYLTTVNGDATKLGLTTSVTTATTSVTHGFNTASAQKTNTVTEIMTSDTTLSQINVAAGNVTVVQDGTTYTVTMTTANTIGDLIGALAGHDISGEVHGGTLFLRGTSSAYIIGATGGLASNTGLSIKAAYTTVQTVTTTGTNGTSRLNDRQITNNLNADTTFWELGGYNTSNGNLPNGKTSATSTVGVRYDEQAYTITMTSTNTVGDLQVALAAYGVETEVHNGSLTAIGTSEGWIETVSGFLGTTWNNGSGNVTGLGLSQHYHTDVTSTTLGVDSLSNTLTVTWTHDMTTDTRLDANLQLAANGTVTIVQTDTVIQNGNDIQTGSTVVVTVTTDMTIDDMLTTLAGYGISGQVIDGKLTLTGGDNSYIYGMSNNLKDKLKLSTGNGVSYTTSTHTVTHKMQGTTNIKTDFGVTNGNIEIIQEGVHYTVNFTGTTAEDFCDLIAQYGFDTYIDSDGRLQITGIGNSYIASVSGGSNILTKLGLTKWTLGEITQTSDDLKDTNHTDKINGSTKLVDLQDSSGNNLGITAGSFYLYDNGVRNTLSITNDTTVDDLMGDLALYGMIADISEDGSISLSGHNNSYLETSMLAAPKSNSNIVSTLFSEWDFNRVYDSNDLTRPVPIIEAITRETKLSNIAEGTYTAGAFRITKDGVQTTVTLTSDDTVGTFIDLIGEFGFNSVINDKGQLIVKSEGNSTLSSVSGGSNVLSLLGLTDWITTDTYEGHIEDVTTITTNTVSATRSTTLQELGVTTGEYYIYNNGVRYTAMISTGDTLGDLMDTLRTFGIESRLVSNAGGTAAILSTTGIGDSYVATSSTTNSSNRSNVATQLFSTTTTMNQYNSTNKVEGTETTTVNATEDSLIGDLKYTNNLGVVTNSWTLASNATASISVTVDGVNSVISVNSTDTVGDLLGKFRALGLEATISDGNIVIQSGYKDMTINSTGTSNIFKDNTSKLKLTFNQELGGYSASSVTVNSTTTHVEEHTVSAAKYADLNTKLSDLNITTGTDPAKGTTRKLSIYRNGKKVSIDLDDNCTFSSLNTKLTTAFGNNDVQFSFDSNGRLIIKSASGATVNVGAATDNTNFVSIVGTVCEDDGSVVSARDLFKVNGETKITTSGIFRNGNITTGTFVVGDATISVSSTTTMNDIVTAINSNEASCATAYWDSVSGQLQIESNTAGSSFINIEKGTSNFTDVMGYTKTSGSDKYINIISQDLGHNAKFTINGTTYTSNSNTVKEDVSRIEGVTFNLKSVSEGEVVKLTVSKDSERLASAVSEVIDSYNELMRNVDEAIAKEGDLSNQTTLKSIRNQLRSIMTSSEAVATTYKNISAIGISTSAASGSNTSVTNDAIIKLTFDADTFKNKFEGDWDAVKYLLVGTSTDTGIFNKLENVVESALTSVTGYFDSANRAFNTQITNLNNKITKANKALDSYREQLEAKFKSMDMLIAQMQQQYSSFLKS